LRRLVVPHPLDSKPPPQLVGGLAIDESSGGIPERQKAVALVRHGLPRARELRVVDLGKVAPVRLDEDLRGREEGQQDAEGSEREAAEHAPEIGTTRRGAPRPAATDRLPIPSLRRSLASAGWLQPGSAAAD